jgi:hypothetical protein
MELILSQAIQKSIKDANLHKEPFKITTVGRLEEHIYVSKVVRIQAKHEQLQLPQTI